MNLGKFEGRGLFVFSDPAGAKAVLAQAYQLKQEKYLTDFLVISDRNYSFFEDFGLKVKPYQANDEILIFDDFKPDFLFTGTSYTSKIELKFIQEAQRRNVRSYAFIDHWVNFRSRFVWNENLILPDLIWVIDNDAKKLALQEGLPEAKIVVAENPYYDFLRNWKPAICKEILLANLNLPKNASYILYVPEPLSQVGGREKFGFDEFEVLEKIISDLSEKYLLSLQAYFLIKPHPNHNLETFEEIFRRSKHQQIRLISAEISINTLMFYADLVIGIFSNALIEGRIIGAKVVRFLPESCKMDLLEVNQEIKLLEISNLSFFMNHQNIVKKSNQIYDEAFAKYGNDVRSNMYANPIRQYLRFKDLCTYIDLNDSTKTVLDVGCGSGEMYKYLKMQGFRGKYVGFDINQNLLNLAKQRFTDIEVHLVDILEQKVDTKFDYVVMSGVFNLNVGQKMDWIFAFVSKMFELCNNHIAFNALSTYVNFQDESMFYINPTEMFIFCVENLSKRVNLSHHNLPYNYTLTVFKEQDINTSFENL